MEKWRTLGVNNKINWNKGDLLLLLIEHLLSSRHGNGSSTHIITDFDQLWQSILSPTLETV